ncbi:MAG: nonstructural protein [Microvirus sp.]|nr:MAG: nonstructural protein [Microvirus sp.]
MKVPAFSIRDAVAQVFHAPFCAPNAAVAARHFEDEQGSADSVYGKHPYDYALFETGTFDNETGLTEPYKNPVYIAGATDAYRELKLTEASNG